jgi:hypothetical protein
LAANAVPSVFKDYPVELPRQFFKKICQIADDACPDDCGITELDCVSLQPDLEDDISTRQIVECVEELTAYSIPLLPETPPPERVSNVHQPQPSRRPHNNSKKNKLSRKKFRALQTKYRQLRNRLLETENKLKMYNIERVEKDAAERNDEAIFLLEMLRSYTIFEKTREEILTSCGNGT